MFYNIFSIYLSDKDFGFKYETLVYLLRQKYKTIIINKNTIVLIYIKTLSFYLNWLRKIKIKYVRAP